MPQLEERVIAFADILGFKALIRGLELDSSLHADVFRALQRIRFVRERQNDVGKTRNNLKVSIFSDSIAISGPRTAAATVVLTCGWLQSDLLYLGILLRGGITVGPLVHDDEIVYGQGMVDAYLLESKVAHLPRVVVDSKVKELLRPTFEEARLQTASDGICYIDPFAFNSFADSAEELAADGNDPREIYFIETLKRLEHSEATAPSLGAKAKWTWMISRCKKAAEAHVNRRNLQCP